jgi:hypothetical protein
VFLIDTKNKKAISLNKKTFADLKLSERHDLQEWIIDNPYILGENLLIIQKEFADFFDTNERLDLLALDESGRLVIVENKLDDSGKDVVWQALKYVSYCATLTKNEICEIYQRFLGSSGDAVDKLTDFYDEQDYENIRLNAVEGNQRIILVAANFRKEVTSTVLWLRNYYNVDITCIKLTPYIDGDKLYLDAKQIIPIKSIDDYRIRIKKQKEIVLSYVETSRHKNRYRFWETALPILREKTEIFNNVSPTIYNSLYGSSGYNGVSYTSTIRKDGAQVELFIRLGDVDKTKQIFNMLKLKRTEIEQQHEQAMRWDWVENPKTCNIRIIFIRYGLDDEEHWDAIIDFLADNINLMIRVFKPLLADIYK